jgi:hypothetical protein
MSPHARSNLRHRRSRGRYRVEKRVTAVPARFIGVPDRVIDARSCVIDDPRSVNDALGADIDDVGSGSDVPSGHIAAAPDFTLAAAGYIGTAPCDPRGAFCYTRGASRRVQPRTFDCADQFLGDVNGLAIECNEMTSKLFARVQCATLGRALMLPGCV